MGQTEHTGTDDTASDAITQIIDFLVMYASISAKRERSVIFASRPPLLLAPVSTKTTDSSGHAAWSASN